jgi:hypothetical protein
MEAEKVPTKVASIAELLATATEQIGDLSAARRQLLVAAKIYASLVGVAEYDAVMERLRALPDPDDS